MRQYQRIWFNVICFELIMQTTFSYYIILQSALFIIAMGFQNKNTNSILKLYFVNVFLAFSLKVSLQYLFPLYGSSSYFNFTWYYIFGPIADSLPVSTLYLIYFLIQKPITFKVKLFWLIPCLSTLYVFLVRSFWPGLYDIMIRDYITLWYLDFSFYSRILFILIYYIEFKKIKNSISLLGSEKDNSKIFNFYFGKIFIGYNIIIKTLFSFLIVLMIINGKLSFLNVSIFPDLIGYYNGIQIVFLTVFLFLFGYLGLRSSHVFQTHTAINPFEEKLIEVTIPNRQKSGFSKNMFSDLEIEKIMNTLHKLMDIDKKYLDPKLTLYNMAHEANIHPRKLSQAVSAIGFKNFKEYVNSFRIKHAQNLISNNKHNETLYSIALNSGFNSESSFYSVFKTITGQTPKQFKEGKEGIGDILI